MLTKKKKIKRKEIKEDKLVTFVHNVQIFYEENKTKVITTVIVLAIIIFGSYFYISQQKTANKEAGIALARVMKIFDQGSYLEAIEGKQGTNIIGLKKIVEEYGGTENGETAKIYLANAYAYLGNYDEALKYYEDYDGDIDIYKASALAGQAAYYAVKKDYEKAADLYLKAAKVSLINAQNPDYLLNAAINYLNAGNKEEANVLLKKIKEDYQTSQASRDADRYLALFKK